MPDCGPARRVFPALLRLFGDAIRLAIVRGFWTRGRPHTARSHRSGITMAGRSGLMRNAYGVISPGLAKTATPCYGPGQQRDSDYKRSIHR